jgi:hypothetical protein
MSAAEASMDLLLGRYPIDYRSEVLSAIMPLVRQASCACLVGLAGVGKSNLVHFMQQPEVKAHYWPAAEAEQTHVLALSCGPGSQPAEEVFEDMLMPLLLVANDLEGRAVEPSLNAAPFHVLREVLNLVCQHHGQRVVFIFDEFESLIAHQPAEFFERLRSLRDDHRATGRLVYVVITHRLPHLAPNPSHFRASKFFELLRNSIYPLPPYRERDAATMLDVLLQRREAVPISNQDRSRLIAFAGGHSDLLKAVFYEIYPTLNASAHLLLKLAENSTGVRSSCEHIWTHLHPEEQAALRRLVGGSPVDPTMMQFLRYRGLLQAGPSPAFFSPLFQQFTAQLP